MSYYWKLFLFIKIIFKNKFLKLFSFFLIGFLGCELFARFYLGLGDPPLSRMHKTIEYEFLPNQEVKRFRKKNLVKINSFGMRADNLKIEKSKFRVIVYGDSIVWGGTLTDQKNLSTEILKTLLNKDDNQFEVGNISAGSWGPGNWLAHVRERGIFSADLVILVISSHDWNDNPNYGSLKDNVNFPTKKPLNASSELINRYLLPKIRSSIEKFIRISGKKEVFSRNSPEKDKNIYKKSNRGLADLEEYIDLIRAKGTEIAVLQFWDKEEFESNKPKLGNLLINNVLTRKNITSLQSIDKFKLCSKESKFLYYDDIHPYTKTGMQCLGEALYDLVKQTKAYQNNKYNSVKN